MNNIYVLGAAGQLGSEIKRLYPDANYVTRQELNLSSKEAISDFFTNKSASLIINCAAYTQVDKAESEKEIATFINSEVPAILGGFCEKIIHFSTDYVFEGKGYRPYTEDSDTGPLGVYGQSKLLGEVKLLKANKQAVIIRTSWVYSDIGSNFVKTMIRLGKGKSELKVVCDQIGSPTSAKDLALVIVENGMLKWNFKPGVYNYSNNGVASWYDFAYEIMQNMGLPCKILPIKSEDYPTPAKRPYYSVLDKTKITTELGLVIPHWKESLKLCLQKLS